MKSVTFSEIERVRHQARALPLLLSLNRLPTLALTLAFGLPVLMVAFHLLDPTAPLGYIVVPVLLGAVLPMSQSLPGRLQVSTRFEACHLVGTLDDALGKLGYVQAERAPGVVRYRAGARTGRWPQGQTKEIAVTVRDHALEVTGPMPALRALRRQMAAD
jgi:hypothetical protein